MRFWLLSEIADGVLLLCDIEAGRAAIGMKRPYPIVPDVVPLFVTGTVKPFFRTQ